MKNLFNIKDKVVVITGGTGVLGKAIAFHLAEEGAKVVILGRKAEIGDAIAGEIKANGGEAMFLTTDVMNRELLEQNLADILKGNLPFPLFRIAYATPAQSSLFFGIHPGPFMPKTL